MHSAEAVTMVVCSVCGFGNRFLKNIHARLFPMESIHYYKSNSDVLLATGQSRIHQLHSIPIGFQAKILYGNTVCGRERHESWRVQRQWGRETERSGRGSSERERMGGKRMINENLKRRASFHWY